MLFMLLIFSLLLKKSFSDICCNQAFDTWRDFISWCLPFVCVVHGFSGFQGMIYLFCWVVLCLSDGRGNLILVMIMHALSFIATVLIQFLFSVQRKQPSLYDPLMVLAVIGLVLFLRNRKNIVLDGTPGL